MTMTPNYNSRKGRTGQKGEDRAGFEKEISDLLAVDVEGEPRSRTARKEAETVASAPLTPISLREHAKERTLDDTVHEYFHGQTGRALEGFQASVERAYGTIAEVVRSLTDFVVDYVAVAPFDLALVLLWGSLGAYNLHMGNYIMAGFDALLVGLKALPASVNYATFRGMRDELRKNGWDEAMVRTWKHSSSKRKFVEYAAKRAGFEHEYRML